MGDLNGRLGSITGDSLSNTRGKKIIKMCKDTGLEVAQSTQKVKWTHHHFNKGESIIDLVMINPRDKHTVSHLFVHSNIHFGSDHRLVTFNWNIWNEKIATSTDWNENHAPLPIWTEKNTIQYSKLVSDAILTHREKQYTNDKTHPREIVDDVKWLVDTLYKSMEEAQVIKKPNSHSKQETKQQTEPYNSHILELMTQRDDILKQILPGQSQIERKTITSQATSIQKEISAKIQEIENAQHKTVWRRIIEMKNKKQTSEYIVLEDDQKSQKRNEKQTPWTDNV